MRFSLPTERQLQRPVTMALDYGRFHLADQLGSFGDGSEKRIASRSHRMAEH